LRARSSTARASSRSSASSQVKPGCFGMARYDTEVQDNGVSPGPLSKTRRKKQMLELQDLGKQLVELPEARVAAMGLEAALEQAVLAAQRMKSHEAKRRQLQYIGRLMREVDAEPIRERLAAIEGHSAQATARHRRLEAWRERLLADDEALTEFASQHPGVDLQKIRASIRNCRKEQKEGKPPRAFRELFRLLKAIESSTTLPG
jgi:ribosome-associated protein